MTQSEDTARRLAIPCAGTLCSKVRRSVVFVPEIAWPAFRMGDQGARGGYSRTGRYEQPDENRRQADCRRPRTPAWNPHARLMVPSANVRTIASFRRLA
jgi:hypothetical protein